MQKVNFDSIFFAPCGVSLYLVVILSSVKKIKKNLFHL